MRTAKMHYIQCNHCGELIEVKSEYMAFCPLCQAKLANSFAIWRGRSVNQGRSFAEYLAEVAVDGVAVSGVREQRRIGRAIRRSSAGRRVLMALAVIVPMVLLLGGGYVWYGERNGVRDTSVKNLLGDRVVWKVAYYADLGVSLKFPHPLALATTTVAMGADSLQTDSALNAQLQAQGQVITGVVSRQWSNEQGDDGIISVSASRIDYRPDFGVDREVATGQILQGMLAGNVAEGGDRLQAFEFFKNDYAVPNVEARSLAGSYLLGVQAFEFRALMAQVGHTVWYFMVAYPRDTPEGILVAERFFRSILIDRRLGNS
jgi:hypothetical protein